MSDLKEYIVSKSWHLFSKNGIRNVTMDDIANKMGMSKKQFIVFLKTNRIW